MTAAEDGQPHDRQTHDRTSAPDAPDSCVAAVARRAREEVGDELRLIGHLARWVVLGIAVGVLAGVSSYVFLRGLDRVTELRLGHRWLIALLPLAGLALGVVHLRVGGRATAGNALLLEEIHEPTAWVPRRMAPLVLVGTWVTHLFGGSAGREGTALQMAGSLADQLGRALRMRAADRRMLLTAALGGGFGAVFGVPLAGAVFALEVPAIGRPRYDALVPALAASVTGDLVVTGLGYHHGAHAAVVAVVGPALLAKLAVVGVLCGLAGALFAESTHAVRRLLAARIAWLPLRTAVGGAAVVGLAVLFGTEYLGLSLPLLDGALAGEHVALTVFALKLVFTAVTLGAGFPGGEVTPLFVIGATLGAGLAGPLGLPVPLAAAVGFAAVFSGATNTPLACTVMAVEMFGAGIVVPAAVGCVVAYVCSNHRGIYPTQRLGSAKGATAIDGAPTLAALAAARRERAAAPPG